MAADTADGPHVDGDGWAEGWIGGRRFDSVFFFGSALAALVAGVVLLAAPELIVPLWWTWLWLGDGPHLLATWTRTYLDGVERRRHPRLLALSLAWIATGPAAFA